MEKLAFIYRYLQYWLKASNAHGLHSPFMFRLYRVVIGSKKLYYAFAEIEKVRRELLRDDRIMQVADLGAGSRVIPGNKRAVASIAKVSITPKKVGQLLFKLVEYFQPSHVLELGTSLGVGTAYLQSTSIKVKVITLEGCPETAKIARETFQNLKINPHLEVGAIEDTLPKVLEDIPSLDLVFFDANHRYEPTLAYFEACLSKAHENSVFVFDDIHWSSEMERVWSVICNHERVKLSVDLFRLGLIFFRDKQPKQHFVLKA